MPHRAWAEVDAAAIASNVSAVRALVGPAGVMAVVKADAYGHGVEVGANAAVAGGASWLGVATVDEGVQLRHLGFDLPISVFAPADSDEAEEIVHSRLTPFVGGARLLEALHRAASQRDAVVEVHVEIDTGMGRSGVLPRDLDGFLDAAGGLPGVHITGAATHFPSAEDDVEFTRRQISSFSTACDRIRAATGRPLVRHCANSAGLLLYPEARMSLVRAGLLIYGIVPALGSPDAIPLVRPALALKSRVTLVRDLPSGHNVSYGQTYSLERPSRIATVSIGYGDGYPRRTSNRGVVLIAGNRAPILGRVCMDVIAVDVTDVPSIAEGDEAVMIGQQDGEVIRAEEVARWAETTEHDVTTRLLPRVPRVATG